MLKDQLEFLQELSRRRERDYHALERKYHDLRIAHNLKIPTPHSRTSSIEFDPVSPPKPGVQKLRSSPRSRTVLRKVTWEESLLPKDDLEKI